MRYVALATDYDGTLAHDGSVPPSTTDALKRLAATGRKLLLVTGRELADLRTVFSELSLFEWLVVENGAVMHRPATGETRVLAQAPDAQFVRELRRRGVQPLSVGASIVATRHPNERTVLEVIRERGLELHVVFNKGAVMVLPPDTNKASGVRHALRHLCLSAHNMVAIDDAENDHALLDLAECSVAVANAVPMLKSHADLVTRGARGEGTEELIARLIDNDLRDVDSRRPERQLLLGARANGKPVSLPPAGFNILISGTSGSGKTHLATGLLEQLMARGYQCCIIDPEGDYDELGGAIRFGSPNLPPDLSAIFKALENPDTSVVINLLGIHLGERPSFFATLLLRLQEYRARMGRPHWLLVDEAHHLLPADWHPVPEILTESMSSVIFITVHPESLARALLDKVDLVAVMGDEPQRRIARLAVSSAKPAVPDTAVTLDNGEALVWFTQAKDPPFKLRINTSTGERRRHQRKYAEGQLGEDHSFYFRGPDGRLNLRAHNLVIFMQMADGVDDVTWLHHLGRGDISTWVRGSIKDNELAQEIEGVERAAGQVDPQLSRERVRKAIEARYTLPAEGAGVN